MCRDAYEFADNDWESIKMDEKFSDGDSYTLTNLAEKTVLTNNLDELAWDVFPEMMAITQSIGGILYVDDERLLKPQLYSFQIPEEDGEALDAFCSEQNAWFSTQNSKYPLIVSADWFDGERF
jgi:hypothetical protein